MYIYLLRTDSTNIPEGKINELEKTPKNDKERERGQRLMLVIGKSGRNGRMPFGIFDW